MAGFAEYEAYDALGLAELVRRPPFHSRFDVLLTYPERRSRLRAGDADAWWAYRGAMGSVPCWGDPKGEWSSWGSGQ
jgi:hypothetical protein